MGRPRPDPNALIRVFLYIDFNPMSFRPSGRNLFWCVKPDACPFARDPKQDLSSQGSLEMTASGAWPPSPPGSECLDPLKFLGFFNTSILICDMKL